MIVVTGGCGFIGVNLIHKLNCKSGIAIHPDVQIDVVDKYLHLVDIVIVMTVIPGFSGQKFMDDLYQRTACCIRQHEDTWIWSSYWSGTTLIILWIISVFNQN